MKSCKYYLLGIMIAVKRLCGDYGMKYRIEQYRELGAKIGGGGCKAFSPITSAEPYLITVGENVTVSSGVKFITHDNSAIKVFERGTDLIGPIDIGSNSFIGMNSLLLPGVYLSENTIVAAGAVVTKSVGQPGMIIAGNPARIIGTADEFRGKYGNKVFDFSEMSRTERKVFTLNHMNMWIKK